MTKLRIPDLLRRLILGWMLAVVLEFILLPEEARDLGELAGLAQMSLPKILLSTVAFCFAQYILAAFWDTRKLESVLLASLFPVMATVMLRDNLTMAFFMVCLMIGIILMRYAQKGWDRSEEVLTKGEKCHFLYPVGTGVMALLFFFFVSDWTVSRVESFCAPTYDFGIFAQMFHYMKETGLPMTTLERDGLLSHFAVHVSPIYYLMLPIYCLFPKPETLQILQAAVITSSVIPLWLLCKRHDLPGWQRLVVCGLLLLNPAFSGGTSYDIHENCFLTPLILWTLYGIDKRSSWMTFLFAFLTLMVKEDAPVYVAVIGLWLVLKTILKWDKKKVYDLLTGVALLLGAIAWFLAVTKYLAESGDGVMTNRYDNFMYDESDSLITVIKAVLLNPMKAIFECVDKEKLKYIAWTLLPLCGLPLITRRYERYLLLIPYVLVNLMSDYQYQHDVFFQYSFGSLAFLLYLTVVNLKDLQLSWKRTTILASATLIAVSCFVSVVIPKATYYTELADKHQVYYQNIRDTLDKVPDGASVTAGTFYTTYLSDREVVFDLRYASKEHVLSTEYVVVAVKSTGDFKKYKSGDDNTGYNNLINLLQKNGYTLYESLDGVIEIYHKA